MEESLYDAITFDGLCKGGISVGRIKKRVSTCEAETLFLLYLAERTGLEPATPGVTGRYSNQLNYRSVLDKIYIN